MTFEEAISKRKQINSYVIGLPIKEGKRITSLFIGPTDWDRMCDYMNMQNQKGHEFASSVGSSSPMRAFPYTVYRKMNCLTELLVGIC